MHLISWAVSPLEPEKLPWKTPIYKQFLRRLKHLWLFQSHSDRSEAEVTIIISTFEQQNRLQQEQRSTQDHAAHQEL